jgi:serine protease inhibitor
MKTTLYLTVFLLLPRLYQANASPADEQKLSAANNVFAFKLLKQIADDQPATNIFISPYSASTALQMVANGAAGETKTKMQNALGIGTDATGLSESALNQANKEITQSLNHGNPSVILEIANAVWYRQGAPVNQDFLACNREFFGATVAPLNFADPHAVDIINNWASEKTHGRIPRIVDQLDPENGRLFLANAVYFKGKWLSPFDPGDTRRHIFHLRDGGHKIVPLMSQSGTFAYRRGTGYQAVRLPYQGDNLAMYIFLPDAGSSPERLLQLMNGDTWQRITKPGFADEEGDLELPKFKMEYSVELAQPLQELGMKTAFDSGKANFSGISPEPLFISDAVQKTFVEVKEEGTEAAAVTGLAVVSLALPPSPPKQFKMVVDRPFLFLIEDNATGTILFMGVIYAPSTN